VAALGKRIRKHPLWAAQAVAKSHVSVLKHDLVKRACLYSKHKSARLSHHTEFFSHAMAATSEIGIRSTYREERIPSESQLTTNAPLLEPLRHHERPVSDSEDGAQDTVQDLALDCKLEKPSEIPQGWPTLPQSIKLPISTLIWNILVDVALLALSSAFLVFALFVIEYNGKPTSSHGQAAERFEQASKWVRTLAIRLCRLSAY
jgi:hypothetical protein